MRSLLIVMEQAGVEEFPGPLPAVNVVRHVIPMKSPPAAKSPSVGREIVGFHTDIQNSRKLIVHRHCPQCNYLIISLPVAVSPS